MAAISPDELARIAKTTADLYGQAVAQLLGQVARRLARGIESPGWAEAKLLELVGLRSDAAKVIARLEREGPPAVRQAILDARAAGIVNAAGEVTLSAGLIPATSTAAVEALAAETILGLGQANRGILRNVDDIYRAVIAEAGAPGVVTGVETRRQAAQRALNRFADLGITGFRDSAGRNWSIESYAEMSVRTSAGRAMVDGRLDVYRADGRDLVIVSDSPAECDLCRPWEGQVLSIGGATPPGTVLSDGFVVRATVGMARAEGLFHPSCTHDLRPFIDGLTRPFTDTADPERNAATARQRELERQVRRWRRREVVALDDDAARRARAKVAERQAQLREHVRRHDLRRKPERERITGAR